MAVTQMYLRLSGGLPPQVGTVTDTANTLVTWGPQAEEVLELPPGTRILDVKFNGTSATNTVSTKVEVENGADTGIRLPYDLYGQAQDRVPPGEDVFALGPLRANPNAQRKVRFRAVASGV